MSVKALTSPLNSGFLDVWTRLEGTSVSVCQGLRGNQTSVEISTNVLRTHVLMVSVSTYPENTAACVG